MSTNGVPSAGAAPPTPASGQARTAYLATCFWQKKDGGGKEGGQLSYAIARDGFRFADAVNDSRPIVAATVGDRLIRDPMILRDPDGKTFHLVATNAWKGRNLLFDSTNLVHWENERLVQIVPERADKTCAPETRQFVVHWTSSLDNKWDTAAIWCAASTDLKTFSTPKILMQEQKGCLDADILYANGKWHMVYRCVGIWMRIADRALSPYDQPVKNPFGLDVTAWASEKSEVPMVTRKRLMPVTGSMSVLRMSLICASVWFFDIT